MCSSFQLQFSTLLSFFSTQPSLSYASYNPSMYIEPCIQRPLTSQSFCVSSYCKYTTCSTVNQCTLPMQNYIQHDDCTAPPPPSALAIRQITAAQPEVEMEASSSVVAMLVGRRDENSAPHTATFDRLFALYPPALFKPNSVHTETYIVKMMTQCICLQVVPP